VESVIKTKKPFNKMKDFCQILVDATNIFLNHLVDDLEISSRLKMEIDYD